MLRFGVLGLLSPLFFVFLKLATHRVARINGLRAILHTSPWFASPTLALSSLRPGPMGVRPSDTFQLLLRHCAEWIDPAAASARVEAFRSGVERCGWHVTHMVGELGLGFQGWSFEV